MLPQGPRRPWRRVLLMARFTPDATTGLPANRCRSFTPTSVAKMTASAADMVAAANGVLPGGPFEFPRWALPRPVGPRSLRASAAM